MAGPLRRSRAAPAAADHERALLWHDLEVHQEELHAQNLKLIEALHELEEVRDRYIEMYDGAPNGYCTLDRHGVVREINLTGAGLLGQSRAVVVGSPLLPSIVADDRGRFLGYLRSCARGTNESAAGEEVHVRTAKADRTLQLICRPRHDGGALVEFFVAMVDVTERRRLEAAREEARREHMELVRRILTLQEAERRRIARDIHDDLGQQVTALRPSSNGSPMRRPPTRSSAAACASPRRPPNASTSTSSSCCAICVRPDSTSWDSWRCCARRSPTGRRRSGFAPPSAPPAWTSAGFRTRSKRRRSASCRRR